MDRRDFLAGAAAALGITGAAGAATLRAREANGGLELTANDRLVARYLKEKATGPAGTGPLFARSGYLHPLHAPNGALVTDDTAAILGKSPDGLWLRVELGDRDQRLGWIPTAAADSIDMAALPIIDPNAPAFSPMQAFYLRPQFSGLQCSDAPNGLLVQTPDDVTVQLTVNEVQVQLGSTVFFQMGGDGSLTANVLEGDAQVQAGGVTVNVPGGYRTRIPLDASQRPTGIPSPAEPYDAGALAALPIVLLPQAVSPATTTWMIGQSLCVNNLNGAWLRGAPSSDNQDIVRVLQNGTPVAVADAPQFDGIQSWWPLRTGNNTGWIEQSNLTACNQPVPPPCAPRTDWLFAYTVQPGDTLTRIAEAAGLTVNELINGNCLEAPYNLPLATVLRVPRTPIFVTATPTTLPTILPARTPEVVPTQDVKQFNPLPTDPARGN